jgi:hypothetical protein
MLATFENEPYTTTNLKVYQKGKRNRGARIRLGGLGDMNSSDASFRSEPQMQEADDSSTRCV